MVKEPWLEVSNNYMLSQEIIYEILILESRSLGLARVRKNVCTSTGYPVQFSIRLKSAEPDRTVLLPKTRFYPSIILMYLRFFPE